MTSLHSAAQRIVRFGECLFLLGVCLFMVTFLAPFLLIGFVVQKLAPALSFLKRAFGCAGPELLQQKCVLCGTPLRPAPQGLFAELFTGTSIKCTSGHKPLFWDGENMWYTQYDDVAHQLQAKGFKVLSSPGVTWFRTRHLIGDWPDASSIGKGSVEEVVKGSSSAPPFDL